MQKLKLAVIDKMIQEHLTNAEVDFIIHISHFQDDSGNVLGVYYKDICEAISISYQTFYEALRGLEKKNIIETSKAYYGDWNIKILDNDFSYEKANSEGYLSTGHDIFHNKDFFALKANEKFLAMYILKIAGAGYGKYHIGVDKFYNKFSELFKVTKRVIQKYLSGLKQFFTIGIKDKNYWITPLKKVYKYAAPTDITLFSAYVTKVVCRRNRIKVYTEKSFGDTADLINQYAETLKNQVTKLFIAAVNSSIKKMNEHIDNPYKWKRSLQPKFIHKILIEEMSGQAI